MVFNQQVHNQVALIFLTYEEISQQEIVLV